MRLPSLLAQRTIPIEPSIPIEPYSQRLYTVPSPLSKDYDGTKSLKLPDGTIDEECQVKLYSFEANSHEEAMALYYIRKGWGSYHPEGESKRCPQCGSYYYPDGSGECWNCLHVDCNDLLA